VVNPKALFKKDGKLLAFVLKDQKVQAVPVEVGPPLGDLVEVLGGLQEGDKVVLQPPANLRNGDRVQVKES
jgi:multidrug efflux pump subunit AcrA (membrane-fusion protein)